MAERPHQPRRTGAAPSEPPRQPRAGESPRTGAPAERPYKLYRAGPRGLLSRLRGEDDPDVPDPRRADRGPRRPKRSGRGTGRRLPPGRVLKYLALAVLTWLALSLVLFLVSAQVQQGTLPDSAKAALTSAPNMVTSADTVLILGTDQRPAASKEPGANTSDAGSHSDTIMLWRIGGGASRRLSIPRDTVATIPGHGLAKINAGYAFGGPSLAIRTIERFTGAMINHIIVVNLAAFPKFVDAIGGVDVSTGRICSDISGGTKNGGFSLYLAPGAHHLDGRDALTYARTRENKCNRADNDLTRVKHQQQILSAIKSQLFSPTTFFRLPWASWDAPKVLRTDMGGPTLLSLFAASQIGGSAPVQVLKPSGAEALPGYGSALTVSPGAVQRAVGKLLNG
ncbi:MAG: LCP family protein [Solirubrobacteraceae bacterium]